MNSPFGRWILVGGIGCLLALASGCLTSRPPAVVPPKVNSAAGQDAVKAYDANSDGALDQAELAAKCPGILGASGKDLPKWDTNGDGKVSADEINARVASWFKNGTGLMSFNCVVKLDGKPLGGADVVFEPEPFLGTAIKACSGKTEPTGNVVLGIKPDDLPPADRMPGVVHPGLYKVRITHPTIKVPERYNTATTIGQEITPTSLENEQIAFELTSK